MCLAKWSAAFRLALRGRRGHREALQPLAEIAVDPRRALVHAHGWQSWSPTATYGLGERQFGAANAQHRALNYRSEVDSPGDAFQGEGLLAVDPGDGGPLHVFAAADGRVAVPSIRATQGQGRAPATTGALVVAADAPVEHLEDAGAGGIDGALARWAEGYAARTGVPPVRPAPVFWCSWYHYFTGVTERDMVENLDAMAQLGLPIEVVQLDDGYQAEIGDWLELSGRFHSLPDLLGRIHGAGRRSGIWTAPFLVGARSTTAAEHPEWLVRGPDGPVSAGRNWDQELAVLDVTHPGAAGYLETVFRTLRAWGIDFFKIDFVFAGALNGRRHDDVTGIEAYRRGLQLIRAAIGEGAYLLGCGAPILPSVGLVDALRVGPDTAPHYEPLLGDMSQPSIRAAIQTSGARAFQHGRFWVNDADCLLARPEVERREEWAVHLARHSGTRASSDRLLALDDWGLATTRRFLAVPPPDVLVAP